MDNVSVNDERKNRQRGENWTHEERDLFLGIMRHSAPIIENKRTDTNANRRKQLEWMKVQKRLTELVGRPREIRQLKGFWRRLKIQAYEGRRTESSQKEMSNMELKNIINKELMVEEHAIKMEIHKQNLSHQELRNKMEIDILLLEKEQKELEIKILRKSLE